MASQAETKNQLPWIAVHGGFDIVRHFRSELPFTLFRHGSISEVSAVLPRYSKRTMKKIAAEAIKHRAGKKKLVGTSYFTVSE
ncbi:hypothetical protein [Pseudochelatococcus sp. G4_1912]|uniref:hypothetical protein n=1 Tax=Pseudochelatococcus sp. G4_1912 TaxID=3114288 RepID=UPI0039C609A0